jgi:hypothetical protein
MSLMAGSMLSCGLISPISTVFGGTSRARSGKVDRVITIPAEPADPELLPPALKPFGAVPPLITDIDLSVDDKFLYVSCWGTGEMKQFDVTDQANSPSRWDPCG